MPSPFPGMNPYLESASAWSDFHHVFIGRIRDELIPNLPERYVAKVDQHVFIHEPAASERRLVGRPDVFVAISGGRPQSTATPKSALAAPVSGEIQTDLDVERIGFIQILDKDSWSVITTIELISPSNKTDDRNAYLAKRRQILNGGGNLVEIDLLRGGPRLPVQGLPPCDYYALVARVIEQPKVGIWPFGLRDPLPTIPIPLAGDDADIPLNLRRPFDLTYDASGYARYIYATEPDPPLSADDQAWAIGLLKTPV